MAYEVYQPDPAIPEKFIRRLRDGAIIPIAEGNRDYQEFLAWNEANGNPIVLE